MAIWKKFQLNELYNYNLLIHVIVTRILIRNVQLQTDCDTLFGVKTARDLTTPSCFRSSPLAKINLTNILLEFVIKVGKASTETCLAR